MSSHQITPSDDQLPTLELPAGALNASHPNYQNTTDVDPPEIEPIEHRLRVDVIEGGGITPTDQRNPGTPLTRQYTQQTLIDTYEREQRFFPSYDDLNAFLESASAFLTDELRALYKKIESVRSNRQNWYFDLIPRNLDTIENTVESVYPIGSNTFRGVVIVDSNTDPDAYANEHGLNGRDIIRERELDNHVLPSAYGITLPAPLLVGEFASNSAYAFLPWSDAVVCGCPYKQTNGWAVMCKHEAVAATRLGMQSSSKGGPQYTLPVDEGICVPQRARRFVSPMIAAMHTPTRPA